MHSDTSLRSNGINNGMIHAPYLPEGQVVLYMLHSAFKDDRKSLTPLQINKLVYIAHGWILGVFGRPLIDNRNNQIQAWKYGPVVVGVYHMLKSYGDQPINVFDFFAKIVRSNGYYDSSLMPVSGDTRSSELVEFEKQHPEVVKGLKWVYENYTRYSGGQLITLTHQAGTPWDQCYRGHQPGVLERWGLTSSMPSIPIPDPIIQAYYRGRLKRHQQT